MVWRIEFDEHARRQLKKLDRQTALRLYAFVSERIAPLADPRQLGKALQGSTLGNYWVYRVGDYRIICDLQDDRLIVLVLAVGNRREVYRR